MAKSQSQAAAATTTTTAESASGSLLDEAIKAYKQTERSRAEELLRTLVEESLRDTVTWSKDFTRTIRSAIKAFDETISKQLSAIMHAPEFQKLEGSWRGLHYLVFETETATDLKLKVFNATKRDVFKDLDRAIEFDQSQLFKKIYESEFGMPGGVPYGALIGDYEFTNHPEDIDLLSKISTVAASAFCPFVTAASPNLLGLDSFSELSRPRDLAKIFDTPEYIKWRSFRESEDSRFVTLTMPRVLSRLPYGKNTKPIDEFEFEEVAIDAQGKALPVSHDKYCWMNSSFVYGARLTRAYSTTGWCTAIRGAENGGKVENLPVHLFTSDDGDTDVKCPSEIAITDRRDAELSKLGFLPLCYYKNTDYSVFFGAQTAQKAKKYDRVEATENAAISARLPYIMATSRIAHYLKVIARDKIGSFMEAEDCQAWLERWIARYISADPKPDANVKARYPLAQAQIEVSRIPGKPGSYHAVALLRPWLQLEELTASMRLVTSLPSSK